MTHDAVKPKLTNAGRLFIVACTLEGLTWLGLLICMYLKYVVQTPDHYVSVLGPLHGGAFIFYLIATLIAAHFQRWAWWVTALALVAAIPPLVTLPLELWYRHRGFLSATAGLESAPAGR